MSTFDVVMVGSGINALVCAALLTQRGKRVCVLERSDVAGGCIRTEALTQPGYLHDTLATLYPLFVTAPYFPTLEPALTARGVRFLNTELPSAVLTPQGQSLILRRDRAANVAAFDAVSPGDGAAYGAAMRATDADAALVFGVLGGEPWSWSTLRLLTREACRRGPRALAGFFGESMGTSRDWLEQTFTSDLVRALLAPWILHVGLSPESALSGLMGRLIVMTLEQAGAPMVAGGGARLVDAFRDLIEAGGGCVRLETDVTEVVVEGGVARGVRTAAGETIRARDAVVCNVTPTQLYGRLLGRAQNKPEAVSAAARRYRYGRGEMQIHLALSEPPDWPDPELARVAMLHVSNGLDAVSRAVNEAQRGLLPAEATIVVAQPVAIDPSRAPPGGSILWIQLQELPRDGALKGDASGELTVPADGRWTPALREAYADRIVKRLGALIPNLERSLVGRRVLSPADLAALNINLVGGDPYSGACEIDQHLLWRPMTHGPNRRTPFARLHHVGASTHPGPGLGGVSGFLTARRIR